MGLTLPHLGSCGSIGATEMGSFRFTTISYHMICQVELKMYSMIILYDYRMLQAEFTSGVISIFIGDFTGGS